MSVKEGTAERFTERFNQQKNGTPKSSCLCLFPSRDVEEGDEKSP